MTTLNTIIEEENTLDTEWESVDRYSVDTGLLKRFFKLYEEGRKTGAPQNFIDYFKAEHYLLTEVGKAISSRDTYWKERVREEVEGMASKTIWNVEGKPYISAHDLLQALDNLK